MPFSHVSTELFAQLMEHFLVIRSKYLAPCVLGTDYTGTPLKHLHDGHHDAKRCLV